MDEKGPNPNAFRTNFVCPRCGTDTFNQTGPATWKCADELAGADTGGCGRTLSSPIWVYRRGSDGLPADVEFSGRVVSKIGFRLRMSSMPDEAFPVIADENDIPRELWPALRERIEEAYRLGEGAWIQLDNNRRITFTEEAVCITMETSNGDKVWKVIRKPFEILRRVKVDDEWKVMVRDLGGEFSGSVEQVLKRLSSNAQILSHRDIKDILNHLISATANLSKGQYTFGVFRDEDRLEIPEYLLPKSGAQKDAVEPIRPTLLHVPTPEEWDDYARFFTKLMTYEWAPAAGLAAIAPLSPVLRNARLIMPGILHYSSEHGVGKTATALALTDKLWGIPMIGSEAFGGGNGFRFIAFFDAITVARTVDEAEKLDWDRLGSMMKQFFESDTGSSRGTKDQEMVTYSPWGNFIFTMNAMPALPGSLLARLLVILFNEDRAKLPLEEKLAFDQLWQRLAPLGAAITRASIAMCDGKASRLKQIIRQEIQPELDRRFRDWIDNRRSQAWAGLYYGILCWEKASGGRVRAPDYDSFIHEVVEKVEMMTRRATLDPLALFRDWLRQYKAQNSRTMTSYEDGERATSQDVKGDGILFQFHVWEEPRMAGDLVSTAMLGLYNKEFSKRVEAQIQDMPRLGRLVHKAYGFPIDKLLDKNGTAGKIYRFAGDKPTRAVFVPHNDPAPSQSLLPPEPPPTPPAPPAAPAANGNGHQKETKPTIVLDWIRALAEQNPEGVPNDVVVAHGAAQGAEPADVHAAIASLGSMGSVYHPRNGVVLPYD